MRKTQIILEVPYFSTATYGLKFDFETFFTNHVPHRIVHIKISDQFRKEVIGKGAFGRTIIDKKKILFDLQDNPGEYDFYNDYDIVYKRSYLVGRSYSNKVFPYGLRFDVFTNIIGVIIKNPFVFFLDSKNFKEITRTFFNILGLNYKGYNNIKRTWNNLYNSNQKSFKAKHVLYSTRLWLDSDNGKLISEERKEIFNILRDRKDITLCTLNQVNQSEYFEILINSNIVVINNGLHKVPGLRFAELLAMGKVVITLPTNVVIPNLVNGEHFLEVQIGDLAKLIDNLTLADIDRIGNNAKKYAMQNLGPGSRLRNLLSQENHAV